MKFRVKLTQHTPDPYTKADGTTVDYVREDSIIGDVEDTEMLQCLINVVTTVFKAVDVTISTDLKEEE